MSENTKIEWASNSWSPWRGCTKVSAGCAHCYAETLSKRNPAVLGQWGKGKPRVLAKNWIDPVKWNRIAGWGTCACCKSTRDASSTGNCKRCGEFDRTFTSPRVFPSLCDWLDDEVPIEWLARFLKLIHDTPNLDWLLLTKRPNNFKHRVTGAAASGYQPQISAWLNQWAFNVDVPANIWIGTSVEDQNNDWRIDELLKIPARLRFLSVEPMLGPVIIERHLGVEKCGECNGSGMISMDDQCDACDGTGKYQGEDACRGIDWVIFGGESGPGARPCNAEWIRELIRQCASAKVPCFVKQLGAVAYGAKDGAYNDYEWAGLIKHPKGGDPSEWPEDLRVRQFPEVKP